MFNKLKNVATKFGNKKQRENFKKSQEAGVKMGLDIVKLELKHKRIIRPYIRSSSDKDDNPGWLMRQAVYETIPITEEDEKSNINVLKDNGIETVVDENGKMEFRKIEKGGEYG